MSDAPDRRERKSFEPPPWEREQFEELEQRRRQEQEAARAAEQVRREQAQSEAAEAPVEQERAAPEAPGDDEGGQPNATGSDSAAALDEKMLEAMFVQLRAEQPARDESLWKFGLVFSGVVAVVGAVLIVWGLVALVRTGGAGPVGAIGGAILLMFGGLFLGLGVWTAVRSLKERGVL